MQLVELITNHRFNNLFISVFKAKLFKFKNKLFTSSVESSLIYDK